MRASNLTICVPLAIDEHYPDGCDKLCPYCVSAMTPQPPQNIGRFYSALDKVKTLAKHAQVTSVLLTGKGEPFLNRDAAFSLASRFREFPIEIQTNGIWLSRNYKENIWAGEKIENFFDVVAFSLDSMYSFNEYQEMFKYLRSHGIIIRVTMNISARLHNANFRDILAACRQTGVHQLMLRKITIPNFPVETMRSKKAVEWINKHAEPVIYEKMEQELQETVQKHGKVIRELPFTEDGTRPILYDIDGVSIAAVPRCIQESRESNAVKEIRSLILQTDGHVYTSWGSLASVLF